MSKSWENQAHKNTKRYARKIRSMLSEFIPEWFRKHPFIERFFVRISESDYGRYSIYSVYVFGNYK